ncbi:MAG: glycosyltransferase, partial [Candidatus Omnitrophica bacterium]|nr:glycosyltransferase [Candidatus Omnitrophota bacterium]
TAEESQLINKFGIEDNVAKSGWLKPDSLTALYRSAVCTVYPSFYEGFGLPVLEAIKAGGIVAVSDSSSLPEVAGDAVIYFNPDDIPSIARALDRAAELSPIERDNIMSKGRQQAEKFSWDKTVTETRNLYERLLKAS